MVFCNYYGYHRVESYKVGQLVALLIVWAIYCMFVVSVKACPYTIAFVSSFLSTEHRVCSQWCASECACWYVVNRCRVLPHRHLLVARPSAMDWCIWMHVGLRWLDGLRVHYVRDCFRVALLNQTSHGSSACHKQWTEVSAPPPHGWAVNDFADTSSDGLVRRHPDCALAKAYCKIGCSHNQETDRLNQLNESSVTHVMEW